MRYLLTICLAAGLLTACRSTKKIQTAIAQKDTVAAATVTTSNESDSARAVHRVQTALDSNRIDFRSFTAKINVDYRDAEGKRYDLNANLRMIKDSAVWISVNAILGIEAMRMLITRDSVKLLDKQNKVYTARSIDYLQEVTALPLSLRTVQDLLIGNPVFLDSNIVSFSNTADAVNMVTLGRWFKTLLSLNTSDLTLQRIKLDDADITRSRTAELSYSDYEQRNNKRFATGRRINVVEKKKLDIALNFKQYGFNEEVSFPFSVPRNFKER
ncbi:protein of unknown function [Cnuella takakiae]|uniref:Outer membrane lipoprotein-sorting protein n=1 Tax=Cnuella takakiae TaxID=1302690 RepID=A0A1M5J5N0_9BACT|nr:DUF4292 domain-containing protein [Cnuella takakiae]OLY91458.1 hypothetical protein BUE76_05745 [Cnuella takakiae]SHG35852.1 protein of unknown function [Cnuella takakiae]